MSQESHNSSIIESHPSFDSAKIADNLNKLRDFWPNFTNEDVINFASKLAYALEKHGGLLNKYDYKLIYNQVLITLPKATGKKILENFRLKLEEVAFADSILNYRKKYNLFNPGL